MLYRLFIEDFNRPKMVKAINRYFDNYTILEGVGYWQGNQENRCVIEIDSIGQRYNLNARIKSVIKDLKEAGQQSSILVQIMTPHTMFL